MISHVLIDTNIFSYRFKGDTRASLYEPHLEDARIHLCFATVAELYRWSISHKWGTRRTNRLREEIQKCIITVPDDPTLWHHARIMSIPGRPITDIDAWIAATALRYDLPLVTHNRRHFEHIPNLKIISESP